MRRLYEADKIKAESAFKGLDPSLKPLTSVASARPARRDLKAHLSRPAGGNGELGANAPALLLPSRQAILARSQLWELKTAIRACESKKRVINGTDICAHPRVNIAHIAVTDGRSLIRDNLSL
jgi:hypothetical protein